MSRTYSPREWKRALPREPAANSKLLFQRPFIYRGILPALKKVPASCSDVIYTVECLSLILPHDRNEGNGCFFEPLFLLPRSFSSFFMSSRAKKAVP
jgi:hypothetical protein